jgi:hypothetical protein
MHVLNLVTQFLFLFLLERLRVFLLEVHVMFLLFLFAQSMCWVCGAVAVSARLDSRYTIRTTLIYSHSAPYNINRRGSCTHI